MKRTLEEEVRRIHEITYGEDLLNEQNLLSRIWNKITGGSEKKIDDPTKADLVSDDVKEFFQTLENIKKPVSQQQRGSMSYQKDVETIQIGLELLGYDLPKYGIDGLFGPETAAAVNKFKNDNKVLSESIEFVSGTKLIGRPGQGTHNASDWQSRNAWDVAAPAGSSVKSLTSGTVTKVFSSGPGIKKSGVKKIYGDQVTVKSNNGPDVFYTHITASVSKGDSVNVGDEIGKIMTLPGMPSHVHVGLSSGNLNDLASNLPNATGGSEGSSSSSSEMAVATPDMIKVMLELLKSRGVTSEELKKYIDKVVSTGGGGIVITSDSDFNEVVTAVIDTLEGGYYNPRKHSTKGMGDSGETMMGIDRKHGGGINTSAEGVEFWGLIDGANAEDNWKWNYKGGPLEPKLKALVAKMIKPRYESYSKRYLSPEAAEIVNQSVPLKFHFIYAVWNGPGWFQKFARQVNQEVKKGVTDPKELAKFAIDTRVNSGNRIIAKTGNKIKSTLSSHLA